MWSFVTLGYVFMLSTVQIYNLYSGYIFVLCPMLCVRFNTFVKNQMFYSKTNNSFKPKYQPRGDPFGFIVGFFATGVFAFLVSGIMCNYQHLVCKQDELSLRFFETKTCTVDPIYLPQGYKFTQDWHILEANSTNWQF